MAARLAGSERAARTGNKGQAMRESNAINKSLMQLGVVINKLSDSPNSRGHIPYRDSKLTHLLTNALGGTATVVGRCIVTHLSRSMKF